MRDGRPRRVSPPLVEGPGVAGAALIGGRYRLEYNPSDPIGKNMQAYFGEVASTYAARSSVKHINDGPRVPVFAVVTEYDNPGLDVLGAELLAALCARDGACPRFRRIEKHNHLSDVFAFNTADEVAWPRVVPTTAGCGHPAETGGVRFDVPHVARVGLVLRGRADRQTRIGRRNTVDQRRKKIQAIYNGKCAPITMQGLATTREKLPAQQQWKTMEKTMRRAMETGGNPGACLRPVASD